MKKIFFILLIFIALYSYCQEIEHFILMDEQSDFRYRLLSVSNVSGNKTALILDVETNQKISVKKGDKLTGLNISKDEIEDLKDIINQQEKETKEKEIIKELSDFTSSTGLKDVDISFLKIEDVLNSLEADKESLDSVLKFFQVIEVEETYIIVQDNYRGTKYKILAPVTSKMNINFTKNIQAKELKVPTTKKTIILDGEKDEVYSAPVKVNNYSVSSVIKDEYIYFHADYIIDEPIIKSELIFMLTNNKTTGKSYYDILQSDFYLELIFLLMEENKVKEFVSGTSDQFNFDGIIWNYMLAENRYLFDMNGKISNKRLKMEDYDEIIVRGENERYMYLGMDSGDSVIDEDYSTPVNFVGYIFIPGHSVLNPKGSTTDITGASYFRDTKTQYLNGKVSIEFKRKLNTGNNDDVIIQKGKSYILNPVKNTPEKNVDLEESIRLIIR